MPEHFISRADAESDLLACASYLAESIAGGEAHAEAVGSVVPIYLEKGNVDLAAELANSIDDPFSRDRLLIAVAEKCALVDDDEYALQLADAIEEDSFRSDALERIAIIKAEKGEMAKALEISGSLLHPDNVLAAVAVHRSANGDEDAANATLAEIEFPAAAVSALTSIAARKFEKGGFEAGSAHLSQAINVAEMIEHDVERVRALCEIGNAFVHAGEHGRAVETFEKARIVAEQIDGVHRDAMLAQVSLGFLNAGSVDLADRALDLVGDKTQMASVLLGFARHYWRLEEKDEGVEALDEAFQILRSQRDTETRDSKAKFALMGSIAAQFAGFEKGERALEVADAIELPEQRTAALVQIAAVSAMQQDQSLAREAMTTLEEPADRVFAFIGMSDAVKEKHPDQAIDLLREAVSVSAEIDQQSSRTDALLEIAERFVGLERTSNVRELVPKILDAARVMRSEVRQVRTLARLSVLIAEADVALSEDERTRLVSFLGPAVF